MQPTPLPDGALRLADWGLIRARGADAASFLNGQLTSDVAHLDTGQARLAGYCSAKGRLLASFVVWRGDGEERLLACSGDLLPQTIKRLRMFVLRAKCELTDASAELPLYGLTGPRATRWLGDAAPEAVWTRGEHDGVTAVRLPDAGASQRYLVASATEPDLPPLAPEAWRWLEVRSGVARITQATVEHFVPQMLNFELLGGVDFRKGCYPGQEVVARSQYRGVIKRRSLLFETGVAAAAGQEVFHDADPGQPAGIVVNAASQAVVGGTGTLALVEVKLAALENGAVHLGAADGPLLRPIALPYPLPDAAPAPA